MMCFIAILPPFKRFGKVLLKTKNFSTLGNSAATSTIPPKITSVILL